MTPPRIENMQLAWSAVSEEMAANFLEAAKWRSNDWKELWRRMKMRAGQRQEKRGLTSLSLEEEKLWYELSEKNISQL